MSSTSLSQHTEFRGTFKFGVLHLHFALYTSTEKPEPPLELPLHSSSINFHGFSVNERSPQRYPESLRRVEIEALTLQPPPASLEIPAL